jgi:hypothetical protein
MTATIYGVTDLRQVEDRSAGGCWPPLRTGQEGTFGGDRRDIVLDPLGAGGALAFANARGSDLFLPPKITANVRRGALEVGRPPVGPLLC